jgi:hypothetical protein
MAKTTQSILTFVIALLGLVISPISASQTARACFFPSIMAEDGVCYQSEGVEPVSVKILKKGAFERVGQKCVSTRTESWSLHEITTCTWQQTITGSDEGSPPLVGAGGSETTQKVSVARALILIGIFFMLICLLSSLLETAKISAAASLFATLFALLLALSALQLLLILLSVGSLISAVVTVVSHDYKDSLYFNRQRAHFFSFGVLYIVLMLVSYLHS